MDDKNQPLNQLNNQPKDNEQADVSSSAPVEMEPATQGAPMSSQPPAQTPATPTPTPPMPSMSQPEPSMPPTMPESTPVPTPPQQMLEAPKKKNGMFIAAIAVALVVVLALIGMVVYNALY